MQSLLPMTSTDFERDLEQTGFFVNRPPDNFKFQWIWNPYLCPTELLPWLAWSLDVDEFDHSWPEKRKRDVIAAAPVVNRKKGTIESIRRVIAAAGFGEIEITENSDHWAEYDVKLENHLTTEQYKNVVNLLYYTAPARNRLRAVRYNRTLLHNAKALHNGKYQYGGM